MSKLIIFAHHSKPTQNARSQTHQITRRAEPSRAEPTPAAYPRDETLVQGVVPSRARVALPGNISRLFRPMNSKHRAPRKEKPDYNLPQLEADGRSK